MKCPICTNAVGQLEEHHIIPREYGGANGPTIMICGSCHGCLHAQANNSFSKNPNKREYFPPETMLRAMPFVEKIIVARLLWEERQGGSDLPKLVSFHLTTRELVLLHKLKADKGYSSLDKFMSSLIRTILRGAI